MSKIKKENFFPFSDDQEKFFVMSSSFASYLAETQISFSDKNCKHKNIKFTFRKESEQKISLLKSPCLSLNIVTFPIP